MAKKTKNVSGHQLLFSAVNMNSQVVGASISAGASSKTTERNLSQYSGNPNKIKYLDSHKSK